MQGSVVLMLHFTLAWFEYSQTPSFCSFQNELLTKLQCLKKYSQPRCALGLIVHTICHQTGVNNLYIKSEYNLQFLDLISYYFIHHPPAMRLLCVGENSNSQCSKVSEISMCPALRVPEVGKLFKLGVTSTVRVTVMVVMVMASGCVISA